MTRAGRTLLGAVALAATAPILTSWPTAAGTPSAPVPCSQFDAVAAADGARTAVYSPGFAVVERADAGSPTAQATIDSVGTSASYAGYPYPGDAALSALPLVGVERGTYPLTVEASFPAQPESEVDAGGIALRARADERSASSSGQGGVGTDDASAGLTRALVDVHCDDDGRVVAAAESIAEGLNFGAGTLRIGTIRSTVRVELDASGSALVTSNLEVGHVTVAGQRVGFGDDGLQLGDSTTPLPGDRALADVLADAGIDVSVATASTLADGSGASAPTLRVEVAREAVGTGATVTTFTFGRAFAAATSEPLAEPADVAFDGPVGAAAAPATSAPGEQRPALPQRSGGASTDSAGTDRAAPPQQRAVTPIPLNAVVVTGFSVWSVYLVLVVGAVVLVGSSWLIRLLGVRLRWT